jgi:hypothetical protein
MQRRSLALPVAVAVCLGASAVAAQAPRVTAFDGMYQGMMEQQVRPSGVAGEHPGGEEPCEVRRPVQASIIAGYVILEYKDWHRHTIHFRGEAAADGSITVYHLNSDGTYSPLTGHIGAGQFTGETLRGRCYYEFSLHLV